jgi:predicted phage baseplate assembly protein
VQITLPDRNGLRLWQNIEPLEAGVGDFPPAIDDANVDARVVTWLRFSAPPRMQARILWAGINAAMASQRVTVVAERLPDGTGAPDQVARLSKRPVLPGSVRLFVSRADQTKPAEWTPIDDLSNAGAEVPVSDPRVPPVTRAPKPAESQVFQVDVEAGELHFGDGLRGARPALGAVMTVNYDYSEGADGNVNESAIKTGPALAPGFTVTNPVPTWGGAAAESVDEGEKQVQRWMQHRDRLVSAEDFAAITWRTPGADIGRVDVIPAASPEFGDNEPGDAPGAVTLMLIPRRDPDQPDAPRPDRLFLDTICAWLEDKRLVTTEIFLRGPDYKNIWVSVGIDIAIEKSIAEVRAAVEQAIRSVLAPLPPPGAPTGADPMLPVFARPSSSNVARGWPLRKPVVALELAAVVARVDGVTAVRDVLLAGDDDTASQSSIDMSGLELPRIAGITVGVGQAPSLADLRGITPGVVGPIGFVPVPVVPQEC